MPDEVKLLPCPFCGGEASGYPHFEDANSSTPGCYIVCHACDVTPDGCYRKADEWDQAVAIWNTRPTIVTDEVVERVARAICWAFSEETDDCSSRCMAAGKCMIDEVQDCFKRDARAAIAAMPTIPEQPKKLWRCVECKTVVSSDVEPKRCDECMGRQFAEVANGETPAPGLPTIDQDGGEA